MWVEKLKITELQDKQNQEIASLKADKQRLEQQVSTL